MKTDNQAQDDDKARAAKWLWKMDYCRTHRLHPGEKEAWELAEKKWKEAQSVLKSESIPVTGLAIKTAVDGVITSGSRLNELIDRGDKFTGERIVGGERVKIAAFQAELRSGVASVVIRDENFQARFADVHTSTIRKEPYRRESLPEAGESRTKQSVAEADGTATRRRGMHL